MQNKVLQVSSRDQKKKNSCNRLRAQGFIPGTMYSHGTSKDIMVAQKDFASLFKGSISESVLFNLNLDGKDEKQMAFVKDYQRHPSTGQLLHVYLFKVTGDEKLHTTVPLKIVGTAKGTKVGGLVEISKHDIEVECLPADLPEIIEVDIADLGINDYIHAKDIKVKEGVTIKTNPETVIVSVQALRMTSEETEGVSAQGEGEAKSKEASE